MQVVPRNVTAWNSNHPDQAVTWEAMTGKTRSAVKRQIQLGVSILRSSLAWLEEYGFPSSWPAGDISDEQIKIGLMVYAWGPGNMKPYLDELRTTGKPVTAAEISAAWPELGKPKNQPLSYSRTVWNKAYGAGDVPPGPVKEKRSSDGLGWGILAIVAMAVSAIRR